MTDIATLNAGARRQLGHGLVHDVKRPLDIDQLKADYRNHKIVLRGGGQLERYVPAPEQLTYLVPVTFSRTMQHPLVLSRAVEFYVKVTADDKLMAASLAGSIVRHRYAAPRHSTRIDIGGIVEL